MSAEQKIVEALVETNTALQEEIEELKAMINLLRGSIEGYFHDVCNYQPMSDALDKTTVQQLRDNAK